MDQMHVLDELLEETVLLCLSVNYICSLPARRLWV